MIMLHVMLMLAVAQVETVTPRKRSPLFSALSTGEYFGETYTERKMEDRLIFVFFVGEPIRLRVVIGNRGPGDQEFRFKGAATEDTFAIQASRDGHPIDLDVSFDDGQWLRVGGGTSSFDRTGLTHLKALETVQWSAKVDTTLPPGRYRLRIEANGAIDGNGLPILPDVATHEFEVLPSSAAAQPEIARREALRHFSANRPDELDKADAAVNRLLQLHPNSYEGFLIRGYIADARGEEARATASYNRAAAILRNDQDELLMKFKGRPEREQLLRSVDALANRKQ